LGEHGLNRGLWSEGLHKSRSVVDVKPDVLGILTTGEYPLIASQ